MINSNRGFTLIEVMVVVVVIAILAAIAFPSYQAYVRRAAEAGVTQEMLKVSELLEKHKAKNFTYKCFDLQDYYGGTVDNLTAINYPINAVWLMLGPIIKFWLMPLVMIQIRIL